MNADIRKLTPLLAEAYVSFFDATPHNFSIAENTCYCVTWRSDDSYVGNGDHWYSTRAERRERALQFVRCGSLQGYLAYYGDEIVGWCNANADCQLAVNYLRGFWPIEEYAADIKIKSVFCFVIAPKMQRMGIATQLLERVCVDAAEEGYDFVEAYANKDFKHTDHEFRGPMQMYKKMGFKESADREGRIVLRKALK